MATAKVENYTAEQTAQLIAGYNPQASETERKAQVDSFAVLFGKSARSIVAKLSREKVYVAKQYVTKTGAPSIKKDAHADAIGAVLNLSENDIESLTKANKSALVVIFAALANSKPLENGEVRAGETAPNN